MPKEMKDPMMGQNVPAQPVSVPPPVAPVPVTAPAPKAVSKNKVRVYTVLDSALQYDLNSQAVDMDGEGWRKRGKEIASVEFKQAGLEDRYVATGAMRLVREVSPDDWAAEQEAAKADASK